MPAGLLFGGPEDGPGLAIPGGLHQLMPEGDSLFDTSGGSLVRLGNGFASGSRSADRGKTKEELEAAKKQAEENEKKLAMIYESFNFEPLWAKLSEALTRLEDDPSAAQVLLPLIEVRAAGAL